ncbi:MAG: sigma-70 family RNA polymerase sigma factor [Prevotella sp.]
MENDQKTINKLIRDNQGFVISIAQQYKHRGLDMDDLISEGNIGMLTAAKSFDTSRGKNFATYAAPFIRDAIGKAIEQLGGIYRVPRDASNPTLEKKRSRALSIDAPVGGSNELSLAKVIPDQGAPDPEKELQKSILENELKSILADLQERDRHVVQRFYGIGVEPRTMAEIGEEMGLKRERVRQIRDHAVRAIIKKTHDVKLKDYLKS